MGRFCRGRGWRFLPRLFLQPLQHGNRAGQHGRHLHGQGLPGVLLAFAHLRLAAPGVDFAKVQAHQGVGVVHQLLAPGADGGSLQRQAQLFIEFARQGLGDGFARFELAARKFPVARVGFAGRARGEQE